MSSTRAPTKRKGAKRRAGKGGKPKAKSRRLSERFRVPGAVAVCRERAWLFFWKRVGPPCKLYDMCLRGVSLQNTGRPLKEGAAVRLEILLTPPAWSHMKGKVAWVKDDEEAGHQFCGIQFTDFSGAAWSNLCAAYAQYREGSGWSGRDMLETFDVEAVREELPELDEAVPA